MQARVLLELIALDDEIHLASIEMLPTTSLRLAINGASTSGRSIAAATKQSASAFAKANAGDAIEKNTGEMAHSRLVVQESKVICNHNFV